MTAFLHIADALFREDPIAGGLVALIVIASLAILAKIAIDALWGGQ